MDEAGHRKLAVTVSQTAHAAGAPTTRPERELLCG